MKYRVRKHHIAFRTLLILMGVLFCLQATNAVTAQDNKSQPTTSKSAAGSGTPTVVFAPDEDYRIGPGDVIDIQVEDAAQLSGNRRVTAAGNIPMPYLKKISVLNKTTEEVAAAIADGLRGRYLKDPQVYVTVVHPNSRMFMIQGAVRVPGTYYIEGRPTLVKLISAAGGLGDNYGSTAFILRENKSDAKEAEAAPANNTANAAAAKPAGAVTEAQEAASADYEIIPVNIARFLKGVVGNASLYIKPGDVVNVPPTDVFFVAGEVRKPGDFPLKDGTTLRQAISLAQGMNFAAAPGRAVIFREGEGGKRIEIPVDISAVMGNKKPDVTIMPNDVIMVPNSRTKSVLAPILQAFGASSARIPIF